MKRKTRKVVSIILITVSLIVISVSTVSAQEDGFTEPFDDPELAGWEHTPETIVSESVLAVGSGNYAIRIGNYPNFTAEFDVRFSGSGIVFFRYNMREDGDYALIFFEDRVVFEKVTQGEPRELASAEWSGFSGDWDNVKVTKNSSQHELVFNNQTLLTATDENEPYNSGGLGFMVEADTSAEFDNLTVNLLEGSEAPMEGEGQPEEAALVAAPTAEPTAQSGIEGFLAQLTAARGTPPELTTSAINLLLSVFFAYLLSRVYIHWGSSLSNRRRFASNFILITVTTTFIILIVRSSVALSLGLVGALSIVRFRAAIKEPEELAYLFFAIGIGIGLGDNQRLITVLAVAVAILVIMVMRLFRGRQEDFNLHLTVACGNPGKVPLEAISDVLKKHAAQSRLMRFDENKQNIEASYLVEFRNNDQFTSAKNALQALSKEIEITFMDNKGLG